jgi:ribosomal-protein-alanine N-acetyltransferase
MAMRLRKAKATEVIAPYAGAVVDIEVMRRRHVRAVTMIENQIFPRPWSAALYYSELAQPATRLYYVATVQGEVVGYCGAMLIAGEAHVTTVGVAPEWQRRRVGLRLFHRLVSDAVERGAESLTLEVRVTNHGAQELYRSFGFAPAGIRKNYYAEVNEDGLVMWAHDVHTEEYAQRLAELGKKIAEPEDEQ